MKDPRKKAYKAYMKSIKVAGQTNNWFTLTIKCKCLFKICTADDSSIIKCRNGQYGKIKFHKGIEKKINEGMKAAC